MPVLEDYESIQIAIMQVLRKLTTGHLDRKTAGLLLYGLQIASSNLRFAQFEPTIRETVVIDPMTTHMTPLDADQWSEDDDEDEEEDAEEEDAGDENEIDGEDETEADDNPDDELGDDAELEEQEEESSAGVPPAVVSAPSPCASAVGAAASQPGDSSNSAAGVGADAPVRAGAERGETKKPPQAEPKISDAQFFQALANLADHMENGTPLKFPVYPARPPASLDSEKNGKRKSKNGG